MNHRYHSNRAAHQTQMSALVWQGLSSTTLFVCAVGFLSVSLFSANRTLNGATARLTAGQISLTGMVLPTHPAYPLFRAWDRVVLWQAQGADKTQLHLAYAFHRLSVAQLLAEQGELAAATSALSKSQQYALAAANGLSRAGSPATQLSDSQLRSLDLYQYQLQQLITTYPALESRNTLVSQTELLAIINQLPASSL